MCPLQGKEGMFKDAQRFPQHFKAFINTFRKMLEKKEYDWKTPEDVMYWWITGKNERTTDEEEKIWRFINENSNPGT